MTNVIKNTTILIILFFSYAWIEAEFNSIQDPETVQTLILFVGLVLVAPLFAIFSFTYEESRARNKLNVLVSHSTTSLALLIVGILMIMIDVLFLMMVGNLLTFRITLLLFYICVVLYDFWDYWRNDNFKDRF